MGEGHGEDVLHLVDVVEHGVEEELEELDQVLLGGHELLVLGLQGGHELFVEHVFGRSQRLSRGGGTFSDSFCSCEASLNSFL